MGTTVTVSGNNYTVPSYNDTGWAQGSGNLSQLLIALAAVTASTPSFMQTTAVASTPYTVATGHTYLVASNSLAVTLQLPTPTVNTYFFVIDSGGNSLTNNITVKRASTETINGVQSNLILNTNYGSWGFVSDGSNWFVLFGNLIVDDTDGHIYRILTTGGIVTTQQVA